MTRQLPGALFLGIIQMTYFERMTPENETAANAAMVEIAGELTEWVYAGGIKALALVTVDSDDECRTRIVYKDGSKITLLGGVTILQTVMAREMTERPPKGNPLDRDDPTEKE
jgi:hypothetical protein